MKRGTLDRAAWDLLPLVSLPDGRPWVRPPWMDEGLVRPLLDRGPDGAPRFPLFYAESPKGVGKSFGVLAVHLAEALAHPGTLVLVAGRDRDAIETDRDFLAGMVARSPALKRRCRVLADKIETDGGSRFEFLASDERGLHGAGGTHRQFRAVLEDPFAWVDPALLDSMLATSGKVPNARVSVLTNPAPKRSGRLWAIRAEAKRRHGRTAWAWTPWADGKPPPVPWIAEGWKASMRGVLPAGVYARFIEGKWDESASFVPRVVVAACVGSHLPAVSGPHPTYVGLDLGIRKHFTGEAWGHAAGGRFVVDGAVGWDPSDAPDGEILLRDVAESLRALARGFPLRAVLCDPFQAYGLMQDLKREGLPIEEFSFGVPNQVKLAGVLFESLTHRTLALPADAEESGLVDEIAGLDCVPVGLGFRFAAGSAEHGHADRAVALALAYFAAVQRGLAPVAGEVRLGAPRAAALESWAEGRGLIAGEPGPCVSPFRAAAAPGRRAAFSDGGPWAGGDAEEEE